MDIEGPFFWLGTPMDHGLRPWRLFAWRQGVMVNAYEALMDPRLAGRLRRVGVHGLLGFGGPVMMDSGGFQFLKRSVLDVDPLVVLRLYLEGKPNFGVVLDLPLGLSFDGWERRRRQLATLRNTEVMFRHHESGNPVLVPVVHASSPQSAAWYLRKLLGIADFQVVGVGGLVPAIFNMKGGLETHRAISTLFYVRRALPDKILHVFGIGSTLSMHLMFYAGVDSVDSSAWRRKAAYGAIQLPGIGDRYITPRRRHKKYLDLSPEERRVLEGCGCPACREHGLERLRQSFTARAIHNAWVYQSEASLARKLVKSGEYEKYVEEVLGKNVRFAKLLGLAKRHRRLLDGKTPG